MIDPRGPLALLAAQFGAEVSVRVGAVTTWAEMRLRHPWRPVVTGDGWPVSRRVCRPGAVCGLCRFGAREIES